MAQQNAIVRVLVEDFLRRGPAVARLVRAADGQTRAASQAERAFVDQQLGVNFPQRRAKAVHGAEGLGVVVARHGEDTHGRAQIAQRMEQPKRLPARVGQIAAQQHQIGALID